MVKKKARLASGRHGKDPIDAVLSIASRVVAHRREVQSEFWSQQPDPDLLRQRFHLRNTTSSIAARGVDATQGDPFLSCLVCLVRLLIPFFLSCSESIGN